MTDQSLKAVLLYPKSGYKPMMRSDTLWGTICWAIRSLYGVAALEKWLDQYLGGTPPLLISSTFLFEEEINDPSSRTFYLPRPKLPKSAEEQPSAEAMALLKKEKKIDILPAEMLQKLASGLLSNRAFTAQLRQQLKGQKEMPLPKKKTESFTRNTIDRLTGGTLQTSDGGLLFHDEERFVQGRKLDGQPGAFKNAGLYFLVQGDTTLIDACFRYLGHIGIGGDRSIGKGVFDHKIVPFPWEEPEKPNACMSLSLFQPSPEQLQGFIGKDLFYYQLEQRQGEVSFGGYGRIQKVRHHFFTEGSVFPYTDSQPWGSILDVLPTDKRAFVPHPVYQYAYGLTLPLQLSL